MTVTPPRRLPAEAAPPGRIARHGIIGCMTQRQHRPATAACVLVAVLLAAGPARAQPAASTGASAEEAPPVYEIEFLIFAYNDFNPLEEEFPPERPHWPKQLQDVMLGATPETLPGGSAAWYLDSVLRPADSAPLEPSAAEESPPDSAPLEPPAAEESPPGGAAAAEDGGGDGGASAASVSGDGRWYRLLDADALELDRAAERLARLDAYTPLLHAGWSQAALLEDQARAFQLGWLGSLQPSGSIRLHRSRFLHLTLDVGLQSDYRFRQAPLAPDARWPLAEFVGPVKYRIAVQRRVRTGEVHFFDHPAFGVLVVVRPAPEPDEAAAGPAA